MARTSSRKRFLVPLLCVLLLRAAAAPTAQDFFSRAKRAWSRGEVQETVDLAAAALKKAGDDDSELAWRIRFVAVDALVNYGRSPEAVALLRRPFPRQLAGTAFEVLQQRALAVAYRKSAPDDAKTYILRAHSLAAKHPRTLPAVLLILGTYEKDAKQARAHLDEALRIARRFNDVDSEMRVLGTIGRNLALAERFDEAIELYEAALPRARAAGNQTILEKYEGNTGWCYLELGDYEAAQTYMKSALETANRIQANKDAVVWTFHLGNIRLHHGDVAGARTYYQSAYDRAVAAQHDQIGAALLNLANVDRLSRRFADAHRYVATAFAKASEPKDRLRAILLRSRVLVDEQKYADAERDLKTILADTGSTQTKWEAYGVLMSLYLRSDKQDKAEEAYRKAVRTAGSARTAIESVELRLAFFTSMSELFDEYVDFLIARGRDAEALEVMETSRAQTLEESLDDVAPRRDPKTIARETGATILTYWLGAKRSYLWVVTPQTIEAFPLPPRTKIETMVDGYQTALTNRATGSMAVSGKRGEALWKTLVEPAARFIAPEARVIVVPHGRLHAFNFETLVVPSPDPHYWIKDAVISNASSLGLLSRKAAPADANPRLLVVGDPPQPSREFAELPNAGEEIARVARHFGGRAKVLSKTGATRSAYLAAKPETYEYLHFVAHGVAAKLKPLDSAVVLAREGDDYKLYARDIAKQQLHARLVTISSCHGAGTRAYAGEGLVGLGWAFLSAGAGNVIASLWNVNDVATPALMDTFYARLVSGATPADALREAKLKLLREGGAHAKPFYWAPFLLYGSS